MSRGPSCRLAAAVAVVAVLGGVGAALVHDPLLAEALTVEGGVVEWLQVIVTGLSALLAARWAAEELRAGDPAPLPVGLTALLAGVLVGEVDLDRTLFGVKIIATRFFVDDRYALTLRALAALVVVGLPLALVVFLWRHRGPLQHAGRALLDAPWGQLVVAALVVLVAVQVLEKPIGAIRALPRHVLEETLELVAAAVLLIGLAARPGAIMDGMRVHLLLVLLGGAALLSACRSEPTVSAAADRPRADAPRQVRVVPAIERQVPRTVVATGTLAAEDQVTLGTKIPGRLAEIRVDLGSRVRAGEVVARLDATDYRLRVEQAEAALQQARVRLGLSPTGTDDRVNLEETALVRQARAVLDEARLTRERSVRLLEQDLIARAQLDAAEAALQVAEGRYQDALEEVRNRQAVLAQRRSELALARQQLADTTIVSPVDGAVSQRRASVGEYLAAGAPVATLVRIDPLRLRVSVPEREAGGVRPGQAVRLTVEGDATVHAGRVARLSPIVHEQNRTLMVEAEVPNPRGALRPGSFARVEIVTETSRPLILVPADAIVTFAGIEKVLVVRDGKAAEVLVQTGRREGDLVEITAGLKPGAPVIVQPGNLTGGQPVAVVR